MTIKSSFQNQWTVEMLEHQLNARLYQKQGALPNNFHTTVPENLRATALLAFKDEYLLDFINVDPDDERVLEDAIVDNIRRFVLTMGKGFAFIGSQYRLVVEEEEYCIKEKNDNLVRFAVKRMDAPIGVATYQISSEMPEKLREVLPDAESLRRLLD